LGTIYRIQKDCSYQMGILIDGVVLNGSPTDYTSITMVKSGQMVTINLKAEIPGFTYAPVTTIINTTKVSAATGLTQLNACTYASAPIKPHPITLAIVKDVLANSGLVGGSVPEPTTPPTQIPNQNQL
jgi:hypothetical protein